MSLNSEDKSLSNDCAENLADSARGTRITYSREILLLLKDSDSCKKLPDGFDRSILSEFEDASNDRHRVAGNFSSHGFRRTEYGSSPPARGESGNCSRGIRGRWDSRSSGRSDKDSDSQPDLESESGKRYGSQSRRPWQAPEHDGLLGSGSFPRPSGYTGGSSLPKSRPNERYHLNKSSEPYHPPRPYKATPQRRDTHDSYNDETFGSLEFTSEDRAEEERKRRASFELMRKEQVKAIHEQQKLNPDKRTDGFDITTLLEGSSDEKGVINKSSNTDHPVNVPAVGGKTEKPVPSQGPTSRPLVPPGFKSAAPEKNIGTKSLGQHDAAEVRNPQPEDDHLISTSHCSLIAQDQVNKQTGGELVFAEQKQEISSPIVSTNDDIHMSSQVTGPAKAVETTVLKKLGAQNSTGNSVSIIEKLFSSASVDSNSISDEQHGSRVDEVWSPHTAQSSKFSRWFLEEDQKSVEGLSSGQKNDIFSLIGSGEKVEKASDSKATEPFSTTAPFQNPEPYKNITSEQLFPEGKQNSVNAFLTCEDLEQKMLLEASESGPNSSAKLQEWSAPEIIEPPKAAVDDQASHHLLSLLQKGTGQKEMAPLFNLDVGSSGNLVKTKGEANMSADNLRNGDVKINPKLENTLTLETLFGNAFMKELQSARAPVSVQRGFSGPVGGDVSQPTEFSFSIPGNGLSPMQASGTSHENNVSMPNLTEKVKSGGTEEHYTGFHNSRIIADPLYLQANSGSRPGCSGNFAEGPITEAGNLFTLGNPVNLQSLTSTNTSIDVAEKLASLNSIARDERSNPGTGDGMPLFHSPYDSRVSDLPYNLQVCRSLQHHTPELNHGGQMFRSLSSHSANLIPQMNVIPPDASHHNSPPNQFGVDVFRPPFHRAPTGVPAFEQPSHHPMFQQMQVRGSFPPAHIIRGIPPGVSLQPHPSNQMAGFMAELGPAHGLPATQLRPNFDSPSVPMPAPQLGGSSNHPDTLQRLMEMELRSNPKQIHPFTSAGHSQLDMGFGYNR